MVQLFRKRYTRGHKTSENQEDSALKIDYYVIRLWGNVAEEQYQDFVFVTKTKWCQNSKIEIIKRCKPLQIGGL